MSNTLTTRRILIIDDNQAIHEDYRKVLIGRPPELELRRLEAELFREDEPDDAHEAEACAANEPSYELVSAFQGHEGLEAVCRALAEGRRFALAFVDMRMPPGWDGVQTIEHIWQRDPAVRVVVCSAYCDYTAEQLHRRLGGGGRLHVLRKPFDPTKLLWLARTLTGQWARESGAAA